MLTERSLVKEHVFVEPSRQASPAELRSCMQPWTVNTTFRLTSAPFSKMGNIQCSPKGSQWTDPAEVPAVCSSSSETFKRVPQSVFLKVHVEDRPEKCLISSEDVVNALVEQSMELIRRDNDDASLFSGLDSTEENDDDDEDLILLEPPEISMKVTSFPLSDMTLAPPIGISPSDFGFSTVTAGTTNTNETRMVVNKQVGNHHTGANVKRGENSAKMPPPSMLSKEFQGDVEMQKELQETISRVSKKESEIRRLGRLIKSIEGEVGCSILPTSLIQDPLPAHLGPLAREYMTILQLRIKPRFMDFYQSQLVRLLPHNPLTYAISRGISLNRMSPPRSKPSATSDNNRRPPLTRSYSGSTGSNSDAQEFGVGPPSYPIRLLATGSAFADLGLTGSLGLVDRRRDCAARLGNSQVKPPDDFIVLLNRRSGVPLAVCALKTATTGPPVARIYATKKRLYRQKSVSTTDKLGLDWSSPYPLFPWAEIVTEGRYPYRVKYAIYLSKGNDGRFEESPSYRAEHVSVGSPVIQVVGRTEREREHSGCAILSLCREEGSVQGEDLFLNLSVSKGVDPALMLCFAAFVDEFMERTMRRQFIVHR